MEPNVQVLVTNPPTKLMRSNPIIVLVSVILAVLTIASWFVWYRSFIIYPAVPRPFVVYSWVQVVSVFWLLMTRAYRELHRFS